jgi:hypothetical protein
MGCRTLLEPYIDLYEKVILSEVVRDAEFSEDVIIRAYKRTESWLLMTTGHSQHPALVGYAMLLCCYYHCLTESTGRRSATDVLLPDSSRCHDFIRLTRAYFRKDDSLLMVRL